MIDKKLDLTGGQEMEKMKFSFRQTRNYYEKHKIFSW